MRRTPIALLMLLSLLLAACTAGDRQRRLAQLQMLEQRNIDDSLMTDDALAEQLADYFDRHGTPNERLRAHYILGRTYADLGEAPAALNAYQDAADCADTTAQDCDWAKLSRVYGQMSDVFYRQNLMQDYLSANSHSIRYAWRAKDTLQALRESTMRLLAFDRLQDADLVVSLFDSLYHEFGHAYDTLFAANSIIPLYDLIVNLQSDSLRENKARRYMVLYETKSGFFDYLGNVAKGKEVYYYVKGFFHLKTNQYDSAEHFFRKGLLYGKDFANQNMSSRGLARLYWQTQHYDSAAKYALYAYDMNDSVYSRMATSAVENSAGLFNYNRHMVVAQQEREKSIESRRRNTLLLVLFCFMAVVFSFIMILWKRTKKQAKEEYQRKLQELYEANKNLSVFREQQAVWESLKTMLQTNEGLSIQEGQITQRVAELQERVGSLQAELASIHQHQHEQEANEQVLLSNNSVYLWLTQNSFTRPFPDPEWAKIEALLQDTLPGFFAFLSKRKQTYSTTEYKLCILLRLHLSMKVIAALLGSTPSTVSKISKIILEKEFKESGSGKELKKHLLAIS